MIVGFRSMVKKSAEGSGLFCAVPMAGPGSAVDWSLLAHGNDWADTGERNAAFLAGALEGLKRTVEGGERALLIVPLSAKSLVDNRAAVHVVEVARASEAALRRMVALELLDLPEKPSLDAVEDCLIPMMPFFERFMARPGPALDDFTVFANTNMAGVCLDLEGPGARDPQSFVEVAQRRRLAVFVHGVTTPAQATACKNLGVAAMDGPLIGNPLSSLAGK